MCTKPMPTFRRLRLAARNQPCGHEPWCAVCASASLLEDPRCPACRAGVEVLVGGGGRILHTASPTAIADLLRAHQGAMHERQEQQRRALLRAASHAARENAQAERSAAQAEETRCARQNLERAVASVARVAGCTDDEVVARFLRDAARFMWMPTARCPLPPMPHGWMMRMGPEDEELRPITNALVSGGWAAEDRLRELVTACGVRVVSSR